MNPRRPRARLAVGPRHLLPVAALAFGLLPGRAELIYSGWKDLTARTRLRWLGDRWRCASSRDFRNQ
jgi:hypothetical protein